MDKDEETVPPEEEEGIWCIADGDPTWRPGTDAFRVDGVENLTYSNPYALEIERVWFDGKVVYAVESGEVEIDFDEDRNAVGNKVAQEYQVVHAVALDDHGKLENGAEPERVKGQYNIYDSVPGMENYSPLWQFNYVVVPREYEPNTLRSEADCLSSGYPIRKSTIVEN
ncbi:MAG TPA: hypothetical protein VK988_16110 [Acidimicrobiales bacterium]|nr:hypothetical protein [Acidimicrobiales bacterium]